MRPQNLLNLLSLTLLGHASAAPTVPTHLEKRLTQVGYGRDEFNYDAQGSPLVILANGVDFYYQNSDSNFVAYQNGAAVWNAGIHEGQGCASPNVCELIFQNDGNFVSYYNGVYNWDSGTGGGQGYNLVFYDSSPWIVIYNEANQAIWDATQGGL